MKFSIIIPTYNRAFFLPKAIESVLSQTFTDWELIVVDDGSTDNTRDIVAQYTDSRIRYIYQTNAERCAARNNGISHASGEYVCFLDSDDIYTNDHLLKISEIINANKGESLFIISSMMVEDSKGERLSNPPELENNLYDYFFRHSIPPSLVCVSAEILKKHKFDVRIVVSEDTKMWVDLMSEQPRVILNNHVGIRFLFHDGNTINISKRNVYNERQNTLKLILKEDKEKKISKNVAKNTIDDCSFGISKFYFLQEQYFRSMFTMLKSLIYYPTHKTKEKLYLIYNIVVHNKCM